MGRTEVGTNSLRVEIRAPQLGDEPLWIAFEEQSGRVVAGVWHTGWAANLSEAQRAVLAGLFVGFYRIGGVDLVREQIDACLGRRAYPYYVTEAGLRLLPETGRPQAIVYDLDESPKIAPRIEAGSSNGSLPADESLTVVAASLVFDRTHTLWSDWVDAWSRDDAREAFPTLLPAEAHPEAFVPRD